MLTDINFRGIHVVRMSYVCGWFGIWVNILTLFARDADGFAPRLHYPHIRRTLFGTLGGSVHLQRIVRLQSLRSHQPSLSSSLDPTFSFLRLGEHSDNDDDSVKKDFVGFSEVDEMDSRRYGIGDLSQEAQDILNSLPATADQMEPYEEDEMCEDYSAPPHGENSEVLFDPETQEFSYEDARGFVQEMMEKLSADDIDIAGDRSPYLKTYTLSELKDMWKSTIRECNSEVNGKLGNYNTDQILGNPQKPNLNGVSSLNIDEQDSDDDDYDDWDEFELNQIIDEISQPNMTIKIVDDRKQKVKHSNGKLDFGLNTNSDGSSMGGTNYTDNVTEDELPTFITEAELKKLWLRHHIHNLIRKPFSYDDFDLKEALLVVPDDIDDWLSPMDDSILFSSNFEEEASLLTAKDDTTRIVKRYEEDINGTKITFVDYEDADVIEEQDIETKYVTELELQRLWKEKSVVTFGLSPDDYDEQLALLLLDPPDEDVPDRYHPGYTSYEIALLGDHADPAAGRFPYIPKNSPRYRELRRALDDIHDDMDYFEEDFDSFPKKIKSLSPSIETQETPDIMRSLPRVFSQLKQPNFRSRKHNWRRKYGTEFVEAISLASTMDDEEEILTDFTKEDPIWSYLNLPVGPNFDTEEEAKKIFPRANLTEWAARNDPDYAPVISEDILDNRLQESTFAIVDPEEAKILLQQKRRRELNRFVQNEACLNFENAVIAWEREVTPRINNTVFQSNRMVIVNTSVNTWINGRKQVFIPDWSKVPLFDVSRINVSEFVYDCYKRFDEDEEMQLEKDPYFDYSDMWYTMKTLNITFQNYTDHIFLDFESFGERHDKERALKRFIATALLNRGMNNSEPAVEFPVLEDLPDSLMPDKDRCINYSDEIIEMKNYKTLRPIDDADFSDEIFTPNPDVRPVNMIGTIRKQYDWTPDKSLVHEIEPEKLDRIGVIIRYVNYAAKLLSTKDNILVFDYRGGRTRHIPGIRASMLELARQFCPEIRDIRLECDEPFDYVDVTY